MESGKILLKNKVNQYLKSNGSWTTIYVPTSKGTKNYVWGSNGTGTDSTPAWKEIGDILNAAASNAD
jgi:hypothetical protein